ncbi:hypothetical protein BM477_04670 [Boudabousia marimammalium]|uniref:Uncharacterized protein n=1 Tax=Boudabousia marimammalium TaxID=156892 RepID=A0A1Q5PNX5_9ACTO|nr:hypothetical protein BM477_04670 [Boudabousia marimammalium]
MAEKTSETSSRKRKFGRDQASEITSTCANNRGSSANDGGQPNWVLDQALKKASRAAQRAA